jgi:hypothetical protein
MKPPEVDSELTSYGDNGSLAMRPGSSGSFCQNSESLLHRTRIGPFRNLPEKRALGWSESLTAEKMEQCCWVKPKLVCQVAFVEWALLRRRAAERPDAGQQKRQAVAADC